MDEQMISIVKTILINQFKIKESAIKIDVPLEEICPIFNFLGGLLEMENELSLSLNQEVKLVESINTSIHTIQDVVNVILVQKNA